MTSPIEPTSRSADPGELCTSRRALLRGLAGIGVTTIGAGVLVACSGDGESDDEASAGSTTATTAASAAGVRVSDVPLGEARVVDFAGQRAVIAQAVEGEFVAYSARCTHQGVMVVAGSGGMEVRCPAHGSRFDGGTGDVLAGPATTPLAQIEVTVVGNRIVPA